MECEFVVEQFYKVTTDPSRIDEHYKKYVRINAKRQRDEISTMRWLLETILANKNVLSRVLEFCVISQHDYESGGDGSYMQEQYGKEVSLFIILSGCMDQLKVEEQARFKHFIKAYEQDDESMRLLFEPLKECFEVCQTGWEVIEHT